MSPPSKAIVRAAAPDGVPDDVLATLIGFVQDNKANAKKPTREQEYRDAISAMLAALGGLTVQDDALLFEGEKFVLPSQYEGKIGSAIDFLVNYQKQQEQIHRHRRVLPFRPYDGAYAFMQTMKSITGTEGLGVTKYTFFGPQHPEFLTINIDYTTTAQVPWGEVHFPSYEAVFHVGYSHDETGMVFQLVCDAPRKWRKHVEAIYNLVEKYLQEHSIYRGKAIDGAEHPNFLNLDTVDPTRVVYSQEVTKQLQANVWVPIEFAPTVKALGDPLKRAILFAGPYGTGKTLGAMVTGQKAVANGWTFLMCRVGRDDPAATFKTAELYAPSVVVVEDVDNHAGGTSNMDISRMLDTLDGIANKGAEVVALLTTNHLDRIQKGVLRPGRVDAVIEIGDLDREGFRRLVDNTVGSERLDPKVDWDAVAKAFTGFLPAFVVEAARRAQRYTMASNEGRPGIMATEDLVLAADALRPQLELHENAKEGANVVRMDDLVRQTVENVIKRTSNDNIGSFEIMEPSVLNGGVK
jgi:ATPase family associated with various cellular activities (AAA)